MFLCPFCNLRRDIIEDTNCTTSTSPFEKIRFKGLRLAIHSEGPDFHIQICACPLLGTTKVSQLIE